MKSVVFQKAYPTIDSIVDSIPHSFDKASAFSFDEFMKRANDVQLEYIPERESESRAFIDTAIRVSDEYQLDLTIEKDDECITASYSVESGPCPEALKPLFILADRYFFTVCKDYRLMISLDYFTHRVNRNRRLIAPIHWEDLI